MTKWITITVPVTEGPGLTLNGVGWFDDGARGVAVHHEGRELRLMADDIGAAVLVALRAPAGQRAEIQARHDAAGDGRRMDLGEGWQAHEDRGELLAEIREAHERARFANDDPMRAIRELGATRRCAHGADREIAEASDALTAIGMPEDGRPLAERIRALAPAPAPQTIKAPLYVPAAGCDGCGNAPGQRHGVDCQPLSLAWLGGTREATIAKLPADIAALVRDDAPLTPSERAELVERASPATRTFLAAVDRLRAGGSSAEGLEALQTYLRATLPAKPSTGLDVALASDEEGMRTLAGVPSAEECAALPQPPPEPDIEPAIGE